MDARTPGLIAALCVAGFVTWLAVGQRVPAPGEEGHRDGSVPTDGSTGTRAVGGPQEPDERACDAVIRWTLAEVDPRFGLDTAEAHAAVAEAASLWEAAAGRALFQADSSGGLPIRFVYDARQARVNERVRLERAFQHRDSVLENRRTALERDRDLHLEEGARYEERSRGFEEELARHNQRVQAWNAAGARAGEVAESLRDAEEQLKRTRGELEAHLGALRDQESRIGAEGAALAAALDDRNREADRLERDFPLTRVESGTYREVVRQDAAGRVGVGPEIRVFLFVTRQDLLRVLTHELGHALGLEHVPGSEAVMSAEHGRGGPVRQEVTVTREDVAALRARCP